MPVLRLFHAAVRYGAAPVFFGLMVAQFYLQPAHPLPAPPLPNGFDAPLRSMWLMYALMGIVHLEPWLALTAGRPR